MTDKDKEEFVESQKLSPKDKQELQEGACVNCAIFLFIFMFIALVTLVL